MTRPGADVDVVPSGFAAVRTPLLPLTEFLAWSGQGPDAGRSRPALRARLADIVGRAPVRDALYVASPDLVESLPAWRSGPESERGRRLERSLASYLGRMTARATPFGLLAGCTVATIGGATRIELAPLDAYRRHSRPDMAYLHRLHEVLERDPEVRAALRWAPNSSLYRAAGTVRYARVDPGPDGAGHVHGLVAAEETDYLLAVLAAAAEGRSLRELAGALVDDETSPEEAAAFVDALVASQLLVSDLRPPVTGPEPLEGMTAALRRSPTAHLARRLDAVRERLTALDAAGVGADQGRYDEVAAALRALPADVDPRRMLQVDLVKPARTATIGRRVINEVLAGVRLLQQLTDPPAGDPLDRFREAMVERYGGREVPLMEALDDELGIGFGDAELARLPVSPLARPLPPSRQPRFTTPWGRREDWLLRRLGETLRARSRELVLERREVDAIATPEPIPLPAAFSVYCSVAAASEAALDAGDFTVYVRSASGPSGARILGRFCHADPELLGHVREHLRQESAAGDAQVFADIVHVPPRERLTNVMLRPLLRDYEIPYLGRSGLPHDRQIPVDDLLVSVRGGRIVLRSRRLGCEVAPRLTCAYNHTMENMPAFRFLCAMQSQHVASGLSWHWGPLRSAPFLPRIRVGRVVLTRATWNLDAADLAPLLEADAGGRPAAAAALEKRLGLPRHVNLLDGDHELLLDLRNALCVDVLAHQVRRARRAALTELYPGPDQVWVAGPEGRFAHELIVPFVRRAPAPAALAPAGAGRPSTIARRFPPGGEWLYARVCCAPATADRVLRQVVPPVVAASRRTGLIDRWFFIRYRDPDWHLRLRFHGDPAALMGELLPMLSAELEPFLERGVVRSTGLDTYEREVERYGGDYGIEIAERAFEIDSDAVLAVLAALPPGAGEDNRWRLALLGVDRLLASMRLGLGARHAVVGSHRAMLEREFEVDGAHRRRVAELLRAERAGLEALLAGRGGAAYDAMATAAFDRSAAAMGDLGDELADLGHRGLLTVAPEGIADSLLHMHVNRMLRSSHRAQELLLCETLERVYASLLARRAGP